MYKGYVAVVLAFSFAACAVIGPTPAKALTVFEQAGGLTQATPRQIFEGVFFGEGPVGKDLSELWTSDVRAAVYHGYSLTQPALQRGVRQLERELTKTDPKYFDELARDMTSGDPGLVSAALTKTNADLSRLRLAASSNPGAPKQVSMIVCQVCENVDTTENVNDAVNGFMVVFVIAVAAAAIFVAVIAVPVDKGRSVPGVTASVTQGREYERDRAVAIIARRLSPQS